MVGIDPIFTRPEILLHPNIPKPLHGCAPRIVMGKDWWDEKRLEAYTKNNQCCWACGIHRSNAQHVQWLEAHESYDIDYERGRMTINEIVALCHFCHNYIHDGRLRMLVTQGKVSADLANQIIAHGNVVVMGLEAPEPHDGPMAPWSEWCMVIEGREYGPTTPDYMAWRAGEWRNWTPEES